MTIKEFFGWGSVKENSMPFLAYLGQGFGNALGGYKKQKKYLEEYRNWVYACVQARAEAIGNIDLELYDGDTEVEESPLLDLLNRVNPTMTQQDLFMGTQAFLDLDGNAFWYLARDNKGKGAIQEIWLLRPDRVKIVVGKENPLQVDDYVYCQPDGKDIPFNKNEILHFKNFNPLGDYPYPHRGMSVVEASLWAIETDNEARQWNFSFFKNSARPDGFLVKEGTGTIAVEEYKRIRAMWEQEHQGSRNASKPAILAGGLKWQEISRSQKDMDFLEQRRFSRDEILAMFRVPKTVIGITEDVNRANAEASEYVFALRTVDPLMNKIVSTLNEFLVPEFGENYELEYESPVPLDRLAKIAEYTAGIDKWLTRNDIRLAEGLPPSVHGDEIFGTSASTPIDEVLPQPTKSAKPKIKKTDNKEKTIAQKAVEEFIAKLPAPKEKNNKPQLSELAKSNYKEIWLKSFGVHTEPLKKELNVYLTKQEKEVIGNIIEQNKGLQPKEFKFKALSDYMYNEDEAISSAIALITPNIRRYIEQAGSQAILLTGIGVAFDNTTPATAKFTKERADYFAETFNKTTTEALQKELQLGLEAHETTEQLSERVAQFYSGQRDFRSERAARTEVSAASNFAASEAYLQGGVTQMQWLVVAPEDEDCLANDGEVADIGDSFPSGDDAPPVHPNCVCTILPFFG